MNLGREPPSHVAILHRNIIYLQRNAYVVTSLKSDKHYIMPGLRTQSIAAYQRFIIASEDAAKQNQKEKSEANYPSKEPTINTTNVYLPRTQSNSKSLILHHKRRKICLGLIPKREQNRRQTPDI